MMVLAKGTDFFNIDDGTSKGGPTSSTLMMVLAKGTDFLFYIDDDTSKGDRLLVLH